ncbi:MAG: cysteine methyltransferase [Gammaproteobacteria bacterium]|nr:cysteine methyltransferase [Gammaproteobacteria bacterium]
MIYETDLKTPIGELGLLGDDTNLLELSLNGLKGLSRRGQSKEDRFKVEIKQLNQYFLKKRRTFSIKIHLEGTNFQKEVYKEMINIKYGKVLTYKDLAEKAGHPRAYRAVGSTCGANKIPIVIPCHRVISSSGLGGFGGGLRLKKFLLNLESN